MSSPLIKSIGAFAAGSAMSQVIVAVSIPFVARLYGPEVLGNFLILDAFCDIFAFGATLALDKAIYTSRSPRGTRALVAATLVSITIVSVLASLVFWLAIELGLTTQMLAQPWLVIPVFLVIWARGAFYLLQSLSMRASRFGDIVIAENLRAACLVAGRIGLGLQGFGLTGLVVTSVGGAALATLAVLRRARREVVGVLRGHSVGMFCRTLSRHKERVLYEGGGQFLRQLPIRGPVFLITVYFTAAGAGLYAIAFLLTYRPVELIVRSVTEVLRASMSQHIRDGEHSRARRLGILLIVRMMVSAIVVALLVSGVVFLAEDILFPPEWSGTGSVAIANAPFVAALLILRPIQIVFSLYHRQKLSLLLEASAALASFVAILIAGMLGLSLEAACLISGIALFAVILPIAVVALRILSAARH